MAAKRRFGRVRKLPSGRWQARYKGPDGIDRPAPRTFPTKRDAEIWLLDAGTSEVTAAKAYRLLKAILTTAADDGMIRRNPCRIKGASQEKSPERPVLTIAQVYALAEAIGQRYRAMVLLTVFAGLRWGELAALRRCDIDLDAGTVRITRQLTEVNGACHSARRQQPPGFAQ